MISTADKSKAPRRGRAARLALLPLAVFAVAFAYVGLPRSADNISLDIGTIFAQEIVDHLKMEVHSITLTQPESEWATIVSGARTRVAAHQREGTSTPGRGGRRERSRRTRERSRRTPMRPARRLRLAPFLRPERLAPRSRTTQPPGASPCARLPPPPPARRDSPAPPPRPPPPRAAAAACSPLLTAAAASPTPAGRRAGLAEFKMEIDLTLSVLPFGGGKFGLVKASSSLVAVV
jgi:hypothetical protein